LPKSHPESTLGLRFKVAVQHNPYLDQTGIFDLNKLGFDSACIRGFVYKMTMLPNLSIRRQK
jgi:hypothetical protein